MKHTTRILALLLALVLCLGLSVTAFAAEGTTGSITINSAVDGQTYTIYRILELESYDTTTNAYAYKATANWKAFLRQATTYVTLDDQDYVTWKQGADPAAFAKEALAYAKDTANNIQHQGTTQATNGTVTFNNLALGYYLVDSPLGTLCSLDTTNPSVNIQEKNKAPTSDKEVQEDSNNSWGKVNDADIGQTVNFRSTITAQLGAQNYVFHDTMSQGLTFGSVTGITLDGVTVKASKYSVKTTTDEGKKDTDCTFEVAFTEGFCNTLTKDAKIVISYTATLNDKAVIAGAGNPNESYISYGENGQFKTQPSQTVTKTWKVDVFKYTMKDNAKTGLAEVKFVLSKNTQGTDPIQLIALENNVYRVAKDGEESAKAEITTDTTGKFTIQGLDSDTYYLVETETPGGYNKLKEPVKIVISNAGEVTVKETVVTEVEILNQSGTILPSTGGMGTTIFYVLGGILAVGAAVLLVTKKRMERG